MRIAGRVAVVTGGAGGIGSALVRRFAAEGAEAVVVVDLAGDAARAVAEAVPGGFGVAVDVTDEAAVADLVSTVEGRYGRIDLFCSNAGITTGAGLDGSTVDWNRAWAVNVMAHVYAARAVIPAMLARGEGYLLQTCSAAGLLVAVGDAPYTVTKHAAVGFAEWLAVAYGDQGIKVSALCPQGVDTAMLRSGLAAGHLGARVTAASGRVLAPDEVADAVVAGLAEERFLILPHPEVAGYAQHKAADPQGWQRAMHRLIAGLDPAAPRDPAGGQDPAGGEA